MENGNRPLPEGWRWVRLGEAIAEAKLGFASGARDAAGVVQLRMNNVDTRGTMVWQDFIRVPAEGPVVNDYRLAAGDVLFNNTNSVELVGKSALFLGFGEPVVYSNHFTRLRTSPTQLDPRYFASWLLQQWQQKVFQNICNRWIGQSAVKNDKLLALEIPLPPLPEQKRIAAILNEQMTAVERARAAAEAQLEAAKALPAVYLRAVFESAEAQRWPIRRLGELLTLRKEVIHPRDNPSGPEVFVGLEHIESPTGARLGSLPVEMSELTGRKPRFCRGDIVYGYLRPYLNKAWIAEFDGLCSVDQYVYRISDGIADVNFLAWFMRSPTFLRRAPVGQAPAWLPRIRVEEVAATEINLPAREDQDRVAAMLNEQMASAQQARKVIEEEMEIINKLPAALLRRAFNGEL